MAAQRSVSGKSASDALIADTEPPPERMVTVWWPDWPVHAAGIAPEVPAVVLHGNHVVARSLAAADEGVVIGQRRREAQRRCPDVVLVDHDPERDARAFEPVVRAVGEFTPRVDIVEPGWLCVAARGPSRYFGGDDALAMQLVATVTAALTSPGQDSGQDCGEASPRGVDAPETAAAAPPGESQPGGGESAPGKRGSELPRSGPALPLGSSGRDRGRPPGRHVVQVGIADGRFASTVAARLATARPIAVAPGGSPAFVAPLPIDWLQHLGDATPDEVRLFARLGLHRLGDLAALTSADVLARFGPSGRHAHRLAKGLDDRRAGGDAPRPEQAVEHVFEDPSPTLTPVLFIAKHLAGLLAADLAGNGQVCTRLVVTVETEHGERSERVWYRPTGMSMLAMVDRVRWQLAAWTTSGELTAGIALLRLTPDEVRQDDGEQLGLWGGHSAAADRAARAITRLATLLGEDAVLVPAWRGGRLPGDRYGWVPATMTDLTDPDRLRPPKDEGPWPGTLPTPSPATVLPEPRPARLDDAVGNPVVVTGRGELSARPVTFTNGDRPPQQVAAWAGPWPLDEHWWDPATARRAARVQIVTVDGDAHLLLAERQQWWRTATYA